MQEFKKYSKIYRVGHKEVDRVFDGRVYVQEKIDGGNFRFYVSDEGKLIFGTRNLELESDDNKHSNNFTGVVNYIRETIGKKYLLNYRNYIFYGEACIKHTINYNWDKIPLFLGFDVYDTQEEKYLDFEVMTTLFKSLGLQVVPLVSIEECIKPSVINDDIVPVSAYAPTLFPDMKAEGVVFKNYEKQIFAKYVRDEFRERNAHAFGRSPKYNKHEDTNDSEFIFKYCTNARIEKIIMKHINLGKELDMSLMGHIIRDVYIDIIEEEWREILTSNWKLDFKHIRKTIAPRCRAVLEQMIVNNMRR